MWVVSTNVDDISHYGVKGMKWGVRKDPELRGTIVRGEKQSKAATVQGHFQKKAVEAGYANINRLTDNVNRTKNKDGSITVTGLKDIKSARFRDENSYDAWLNGRLQLAKNSKDTMGDTVIAGQRPDGSQYIIVNTYGDLANPQVQLEFEMADKKEFEKALSDIRSQTADCIVKDVYDTSIRKVGNKKSLSKEVKALIKKGKAAVEKAVKNATKKASEVLSNASKKIGNFFESMKPKETSKTNSITIDEHVGTRQTGNHNSNKAARDMRRLMNR